MKEYTASQLSKMLNKPYQTVNFRFNSIYADKRWGVKVRNLPDGSIKKVVPADKLLLWLEDRDYRGRPVFEEAK